MAQRGASSGPCSWASSAPRIQASRTPRLHEREGAEQGLHYMYRLIDLEVLGIGGDALPEILTAAQRFGFAGLNITHPCKQTVLPYLDETSAEVATLRAVNTVVFKDGRRIGHNTDRSGFEESFRREMSDVRLGRVVQFGAGGGGAAVAYALLQSRRRRTVDHRQGRSARKRSGTDHVRGLRPPRAGRNRTCRVRWTAPTGSSTRRRSAWRAIRARPLPATLLRPDLWVADIVYFPLETELLRQARARGCRTMDGRRHGGVSGGATRFACSADCEADVERMLRHFRAM